MRRLSGAWVTLPVFVLLAGSMQIASGWIRHDVASRNNTSFSIVYPQRSKFEPPIVELQDLSDDDAELIDDGPIALDDGASPLRRTSIVAAGARPWGFSHGDTNVSDHFPVGAGPKAPWIHKEWIGLPYAEASDAPHASSLIELPTPELKAPLVSNDLTPPSEPMGTIHVDHFTVAAVTPTPEPTVGLTLICLSWLVLRRK